LKSSKDPAYVLRKCWSSRLANRIYAVSSRNHTPRVCKELRKPTLKILLRGQTLQLVRPRVKGIMSRYCGCLTNR